MQILLAPLGNSGAYLNNIFQVNDISVPYLLENGDLALQALLELLVEPVR